MRCPQCNSAETQVTDTAREGTGGIRRRRECKKCHKRFSTLERIVDAMPMVVKRGGRREPFSREKLLEGVKIACAKRPVAAPAIESLIDQIESEIIALNKSEVPGRVIGDKVLAALRELDEVAYIRYAIVYLNLKDLESVKTEIEKLLSER
jgi:transcriptional repressor NrdR